MTKQHNDLSLTEYETNLLVDALDQALYDTNAGKMKCQAETLQSILDRLGEFVYDEGEDEYCYQCHYHRGCRCPGPGDEDESRWHRLWGDVVPADPEFERLLAEDDDIYPVVLDRYDLAEIAERNRDNEVPNNVIPLFGGK